jgi:hypothetical protein
MWRFIGFVALVIAGLDPAIHLFTKKKMDHRVTRLRRGPVMTAECAVL